MIPLHGGRPPDVPGDAEVWFVDLAAAAAGLEACEARHPLLSDDELARAAAMTTGADDRDLWRQSHVALRLVLSRWVGAAARRTPYRLEPRGRPRLMFPGAPHFSLAHTATAALIGVSRPGAIGVDIEALRDLEMPDGRRSRLEAAGQALNPNEPLPAEAGSRRTLQAWVRFEAWSKRTGEGIGRNLSQLRERRAPDPGPDPGPELGPDAGRSCDVEVEPGQTVRDLAAPVPYLAAAAFGSTAATPRFLTFPVNAETIAACFPAVAAVGR